MRAIGDSIIVDPYYDPEKIGSLYMPDTAKSKEPQQGRVLASGPQSNVEEGDYILFHPFKGDLIRIGTKDVLTLHRKDVVAVAEEEVYPMADHIMLQPNWDRKYEQPSSLIHTPITVLEQNQPVLSARVLRIGYDVNLEKDPIYPGMNVLIQPAKGSEIGWIDTVYYFLRPSHILACLQ